MPGAARAPAALSDCTNQQHRVRRGGSPPAGKAAVVRSLSSSGPSAVPPTQSMVLVLQRADELLQHARKQILELKRVTAESEAGRIKAEAKSSKMAVRLAQSGDARATASALEQEIALATVRDMVRRCHRRHRRRLVIRAGPNFHSACV